GAETSSRYGGSRDSEASRAGPGWFWPATPGVDRHSDPVAPPFHVKRGSARGRRLCRRRRSWRRFGDSLGEDDGVEAVIGSEAKQSILPLRRPWIASSLRSSQ